MESRPPGWTAPFRRYERHLSAAGMVLGFAVDNCTFGRVDHPGPHIIFVAYLALAALSIAFAHALQAAKDRDAARLAARHDLRTRAAEPETGKHNSAGSPEPERPSRLRTWLPVITQFALGGLWSGFLVFYWRSAAVAASWPFLLLLGAFLVGNEAFRKYHARLVFAALLFFFALYSYAVFVVPVFTKHIGVLMFIASGALAIVVFFFFLGLLKLLGRGRYYQSRWKLIGGALAITAAMNAFYFTGILPPLPLALADAGVYQAIKHTGPVYVAQAENEPWTARLGLTRPVIHVAPGQKLVLYSAVFAPIKMTTRITHRWQVWDAGTKRWLTQSVVSFAISGGREHGYRGYSVKSDPRPGDWRVDIDSEDGRLIGRVAFTVAAVAQPVETAAKTLK
ncbi:MAG TPA: DUF2914 domain-containing protein [Rhizomicrobium sp.]|nr:DUF2914 domain-containing protein [Rhizomicrobium sp.]